MKAPCRPLLLAALLTALNTACSTLTLVTPAFVKGIIIYPPAAGEAVFSAVVGAQVIDLARAPVSAAGEYAVTLPAAPPLPAASNATAMHVTLAALPGEFRGVQCTQLPSVSDPAAHLVYLTAGRYLIRGAVTANLSPVTSVLGSGLANQMQVSTQRTTTFADRNLSVRGTLNCTFTRQNGTPTNGTLTVDVALTAGWNVLETRAAVTDGVPAVTLSSAPATGSADWRYLPVN